MHVAGPQGAALQVAELVEHEQRVVTGTAEVAVPGRALLLAMGRALGAVHVEDDAVWRLARVHPVDPGAGQIGERREVRLAGQPLGLEAAHLAGRGRPPVQPSAADDGAHRRITREPLGIVDVFVAGEAAVDRLAQQAEQPVADVLAAAALGERRSGHIGQAERVVQLAIGEQPAVGGDPSAVEFQLDPAVESDPQRAIIRFTRWVFHEPLQGGVNLDVQPMDWATLVQRRAKQDQPAAGGWDLFITFFTPEMQLRSPIANPFMDLPCWRERAGTAGRAIQN